jgi:hypothetical protein
LSKNVNAYESVVKEYSKFHNTGGMVALGVLGEEEPVNSPMGGTDYLCCVGTGCSDPAISTVTSACKSAMDGSTFPMMNLEITRQHLRL